VILQKTSHSRPEGDHHDDRPCHIDPVVLLHEHLERAEPDVLRALLKTFVEALMGAEADALCAPRTARAAPSG
jgi:putative transposase